MIRRLLAQRRCSVGLAWRQRLVLLFGVRPTGGVQSVDQWDSLARERCLCQIDPQVIGPARVFGRSRLATALGVFVWGGPDWGGAVLWTSGIDWRVSGTCPSAYWSAGYWSSAGVHWLQGPVLSALSGAGFGRLLGTG